MIMMTPYNHPENKITTTVRTDASRADYHLLNEEIDDIYIYILKKQEEEMIFGEFGSRQTEHFG